MFEPGAPGTVGPLSVGGTFAGALGTKPSVAILAILGSTAGATFTKRRSTSGEVTIPTCFLGMGSVIFAVVSSGALGITAKALIAVKVKPQVTNRANVPRI